MKCMIILSLALVLGVKSSEWAIDSRTQASIIVGIGSKPKSDDSTIAAVGQNGVGNFAKNYDTASDQWSKSQNVDLAMVMDSALTSDGNAILVGMGVGISTDNAKTFTRNEDLLCISQAAYTYGTNNDYFAVVGDVTVKNDGAPNTWSQVEGVVTSKDNGKTFEASANVPEGDPRYGAFPSENTWYVSQGMWNTDEEVNNDFHRLSSHVKVHKSTGQIKLGKALGQWPRLNDNNATSGWFGAVSKTTDGGKTWTQVLRTNPITDYLYFNQISCGSELNCIVVAEGMEGADGPEATAAYATFDGGVTWEKTLSGTSDVSMMVTKFVSSTEAWVGGVQHDGRSVSGSFYRTVDGGKTFSLVQLLPNCVPIDIDFGVEMGTAACISSSGSTASIAFYK